MPKYLGPADKLIVGGKTYKRGDEVPISAALIKHMAHRSQGSHRFEGGKPAPAKPSEEAAPTEPAS